MNKEILQQAFDALEAAIDYTDSGAMSPSVTRQCGFAIKALKASIAQLEQPATSAKPAAVVAEVHMSRYTLEWTNGPLPEGTKLYTIS